MRDQFVRSLTKTFKRNKNITLITGDLGFGYFKNFYEKENSQFLNIGISEQNMASVAAGISMIDDNVVYIYSIGNFATLRCLEQIRQDICYHNLNVNIVAMGAGFSYGSLGGSHHLLEDIAIMRAIPNVKIFLPSNEKDIDQIVNITSKGIGPTYTRIDKSKVENNILPNSTIKKPRLVLSGKDGFIISTGGIINDVLKTLTLLKLKNNIDLGLIVISSILNEDTNFFDERFKKNMRIFSVEEHSVIGGIGDHCLAILNNRKIKIKNFKKIGVSNSKFSSSSGDQNYLKKINKLDSKNIEKIILKSFNV